MYGDISTEHRVATLNAHRILSRAAGENGPRPERRKSDRSASERPKGTVAGRSAKAK